jgi:predicted Zn-dependent protease
MSLPDAEPGLFSVGIVHMQAQRWIEAEMCFIKVLSSYPDHAAALHFLGGAFFQMNKYEKAVRAMRKSVNLLPIHPTWFENLSKAEKAAGNSVGAQKAWGYAQELRKKVADASRLINLPT